MPCPSCRRGCDCTHTDPGCGHYGCYGRGPIDCPGVEAEERRYAALLAQRRRAQRRQWLTRASTAARFAAANATAGAYLPGPA
jgi:hypothetical protein